MLSDVWSLNGRYRTLHLTWFAFFLTFVVWFNLAPLATTVKADLGLSVAPVSYTHLTLPTTGSV